MTYGKLSALKEKVEQILTEENIRETVFIRIEGQEVEIYEDPEDLPEMEDLREKGLLL